MCLWLSYGQVLALIVPITAVLLAPAAPLFGAQALSADQRDAMERGCRRHAAGSPSDYYTCLRETLDEVERGRQLADLQNLSSGQRERVRLACIFSKASGLIAYDDCLRSKLDASANSARPVPEGHAPPTAKSSQRDGETLSPSKLFELTSPSVYFVRAGDSQSRADSIGSAVAVSSTRLLTNCHVVGASESVLVSDGTDTPWQAQLRYADRAGDRCVLESSRRVRPVPGIGHYSGLEVGERVYTIGNPSGLVRTLAEGLISGLRRRDGLRLVQTSAAISPGSSGGGLFDSEGRLIGITTFLIAQHDSLAFAISADEFMSLPPFGP